MAEAGTSNKAVTDGPCCIGSVVTEYHSVGRALQLQIEDKSTSRSCNAYITGPEGASSAIIVAHDIFGWELLNTQRWADALAARAALTVLIPDFFAGKPWIELLGESPLKNPNFEPWLDSNYHRVEPVLAMARAHLVASGASRVGVIGFCWGGTRALSAALSGEYHLAIAMYATRFWAAPPAGVAVSSSQALPVKCPLLGLFGSEDPLIPAEQVEVLRSCLALSEQVTEVNVYTAGHGFAHRGSEEDAGQAAAAFDECCAWVERYLTTPITTNDDVVGR